jgi:hypothetical protein
MLCRSGVSNVKAVPLLSFRHEGGKVIRQYSFLTSTVDEGERSAPRRGRTVPAGVV